MSEASHAPQRDQLQVEQRRLRERLQELGHGSDDSLAFDGGFADSSQVTAERGEIEALTVTLAETLAEIEDALRKFDEGTYGRCEQCGGTIAEARLEAMPAARLCITCASKSR